MTTGVAIPSFNPLSTVIRRRIREGTAGLVTTGTPSAASVGGEGGGDQQAEPGTEPGKEPEREPPPDQQAERQTEASRRDTA